MQSEHPCVATFPAHWWPRLRGRFVGHSVSKVGILSKEAKDLLQMAECYGVDPHMLPPPSKLFYVAW